MASIDPRIARELGHRTKHYVIAVAEQLLAEAVPVSNVHGLGPSDDPDDTILDPEGGVTFTDRFDDQLGGHDCGLHWNGASGWCFYNYPGSAGDLLTGARWMGHGLLPEPHRVAAFLDTVRLNPAEAGSTERPYYRQEGHDFPALLERLAAYTPAPNSINSRPGPRFTTIRDLAYRGRVLADLTPVGPDPVIDLPVRASELAALLHLLEYAEADSSPVGPGTFAGHLAQDLHARGDGAYESAQRNRTALTFAADLRDRMEQARRRNQAASGDENSP